MISLAEKLGEGALKFNIIQPTARARPYTRMTKPSAFKRYSLLEIE
jgi:hypothetical protein